MPHRLPGVFATPYPTDAHMGCAENCARHSSSAMWLIENRSLCRSTPTTIRPRPVPLSSQLVEHPQLRRALGDLEEAERGAESAAVGVQFHQPSRAICRRIARRSTGFTSGQASWPQAVEVMERIKSSTRTQGSRYGGRFIQ